LDIPGEDLPGSYTATEFVGWYNGHPDFRDRTFDLSHEVAVVVGQGNVAMDVCRILAKNVDELRETDIAEHALEVLAESNVREIHMIGRRGPVQAKFTRPEMKEMGTLSDCDPVVDPADLELDPVSQAELDDPRNKHGQNNLALLREFASRSPSKPKRYHVRFLLSPVELAGEDRVERVVFERNRLEGTPFEQWAVGTGATEEMPCGIVFRSVGYRGDPLPGVPFDEKRGVFVNDGGRIARAGAPVPGLYATGWIKRGPTGIIGTNKPDSAETVKAVLEDLPHLSPCRIPDTEAVRALLQSRDVRVVDYADWQRIDRAEIERGEARGKPREKFVTVEDMLAVLD